MSNEQSLPLFAHMLIEALVTDDWLTEWCAVVLVQREHDPRERHISTRPVGVARAPDPIFDNGTARHAR